MMEDDKNITCEEYLKWLHISISYIEDKEERTEAIEHLRQVKEQLAFLEHCFKLKPKIKRN